MMTTNENGVKIRKRFPVISDFGYLSPKYQVCALVSVEKARGSLHQECHFPFVFRVVDRLC